VSEIKRYAVKFWNDFAGNSICEVEKDDGPFVLYSDYAQQEAECAGLRERVKELEHNNAHLKYGLEDADIDSSAIEAGECIYKIALEETVAQNADLTRQLEGLKECNSILGKQWKDGLDEKFTLRGQLEEARKALEGEFDPHEHPLLVQIEYLRSKLEEVEEDKQKYYELWQNAIKQAALTGKEK
jgi:hypothetical protein